MRYVPHPEEAAGRPSRRTHGAGPADLRELRYSTARRTAMALEERASVCTFDCPDTCSLSVTVDDGRIIKVRGSDAAPYTAGVICNKVARDMGEFVHGPQRLL